MGQFFEYIDSLPGSCGGGKEQKGVNCAIWRNNLWMATKKKKDSRQVSTWKYFLRQEVCYFVSVKLFERSSAALTKNDCRQQDNSWQYFLGQGAVHKRHHHLFGGRGQLSRID